MTRREILEAALRLDPTERELLVDELNASLQGGFASDEIEKAWLEEIGAGTAR